MWFSLFFRVVFWLLMGADGRRVRRMSNSLQTSHSFERQNLTRNFHNSEKGPEPDNSSINTVDQDNWRDNLTSEDKLPHDVDSTALSRRRRRRFIGFRDKVKKIGGKLVRGNRHMEEYVEAPISDCKKRLNEKHKGSAGCLIIRDDTILMVTAKYFVPKSSFDVPGGKADAGETPCETAERETCEEARYGVEAIRHIGYNIYHCKLLSDDEVPCVPGPEGYMEKTWITFGEFASAVLRQNGIVEGRTVAEYIGWYRWCERAIEKQWHLKFQRARSYCELDQVDSPFNNTTFAPGATEDSPLLWSYYYYSNFHQRKLPIINYQATG